MMAPAFKVVADHIAVNASYRIVVVTGRFEFLDYYSQSISIRHVPTSATAVGEEWFMSPEREPLFDLLFNISLEPDRNEISAILSDSGDQYLGPILCRHIASLTRPQAADLLIDIVSAATLLPRWREVAKGIASVKAYARFDRLGFYVPPEFAPKSATLIGLQSHSESVRAMVQIATAEI